MHFWGFIGNKKLLRRTISAKIFMLRGIGTGRKRSLMVMWKGRSLAPRVNSMPSSGRMDQLQWYWGLWKTAHCAYFR